MNISEKTTILSANNKTIAENEQKVYDAGYAKGKSEGGGNKLPSVIDRTVTELTEEDFKGITKVGILAFRNCTELKSVRLPDQITIIDTGAFVWCSNMSEFKMSKGVTLIGSEAFTWCKSLPSIELPNGLTDIRISAFHGCYALENMKLPNTVTTLGDSVCEACIALKRFDLTAYGVETPFPTLGGVNAFANVSDFFQIVVPYGRKSELEAMTNWSAFPIKTEAESYGQGIWKLNDWLKNSTPSTEYNIYFFDANGNYYDAIRIHPFDEMTGVSIDFGYDGTWKNVYFDGMWEDGAQTLDLFNFINMSSDEAEEFYRWLLNNATRLGDSENTQ